MDRTFADTSILCTDMHVSAYVPKVERYRTVSCGIMRVVDTYNPACCLNGPLLLCSLICHVVCFLHAGFIVLSTAWFFSRLHVWINLIIMLSQKASSCPCVRDHILKVCQHNILQTTFGNFTIFATEVHLGTEINWLNFEVERLKGQGHSKIKYGQKALWEARLTNWLWEFHQTYNLDAVLDEHELSRFWGQKVTGQGHYENHLFIMHLSGQGVLVDGSPSKII